MYKNEKASLTSSPWRLKHPSGPFSSQLGPHPAYGIFCLPTVEGVWTLEMAPEVFGGPLMVKSTLASMVLSDAWATALALVALAALAANLFHFSAGVALGGSRTSPGIALGVSVANLPPDPEGVPDAPRPCDVSLEAVDN
jgi:hypothetical protein